MANLFTSICSSSFNFSPRKRAPCFSHLLELRVYLRFPILLLSFPTIPSTALKIWIPEMEFPTMSAYLREKRLNPSWISQVHSITQSTGNNSPQVTFIRHWTFISSPPTQSLLSFHSPPSSPSWCHSYPYFYYSTDKKSLWGFSHLPQLHIHFILSTFFVAVHPLPITMQCTHCTGIWIPLKIKKLNF